MTAAVIWLIAALVLGSAEVLSGEFTLLMIAGGALAAGVASLLGAPVLVGALVFAGASVLMLFAVRPFLRRKLGLGIEASSMHTQALVGGDAVVVTRVDETGGRVKIGGDLWSARAADGRVFEPDQQVTVVSISGATAMVVARH